MLQFIKNPFNKTTIFKCIFEFKLWLLSFDLKFNVCVLAKSWYHLGNCGTILNQRFGVTEFTTIGTHHGAREKLVK